MSFPVFDVRATLKCLPTLLACAYVCVFMWLSAVFCFGCYLLLCGREQVFGLL